MSGLLNLNLTIHVFTPDGDLFVSDSSDGDRALAALVTQYPDATVVTEDRDTGEMLAEGLPLIRLLAEERGYFALGASLSHPGTRKGAA
jgi:hypothetical protein